MDCYHFGSTWYGEREVLRVAAAEVHVFGFSFIIPRANTLIVLIQSRNEKFAFCTDFI